MLLSHVDVNNYFIALFASGRVRRYAGGVHEAFTGIIVRYCLKTEMFAAELLS